MIKIIVSSDIKASIAQQESFFDRADVRVFTADSNEEALKIHQAEKVNLIIAQLKRLGMTSQQFCSLIRTNLELSTVLIIIICANIRSEIEESSKCKADSVLTRPFNTEVLLENAQDLLGISLRAALRVLLQVTVEGTIGALSFFCRSVNISATGMLIETEQSLTMGDSITCSFFLPQSAQIIASAEVIRIIKQSRGFAPNLFGIRFIRIDPEARRAVEEFIKKNASP
jgi:DNA-binding response OmpR family regulator